jgi:putative ABC transport system permease protein
VIGVLGSEGRSIGVDVQDLVVIPVASAQQLFNKASLFRILIEAKHRESIPRVKDMVVETLKERHQGEQDVTVITQDAVLSTFDRIFRALTLTVGGIAAISLAVAGILTMNVMLVAVSQRTGEIGLLKALGASGRHILTLFLVEASVLSLLGATAGLLLGWLGSALLAGLYPDFPVQPPIWAVALGLGVAVATGILFGVLPARRAAQLDPVQALSRR